MKTEYTHCMIVILLLIPISCVLLSCGSEKNKAVADAMKSLDAAESYEEMELQMRATDVSDTPEDFQKAWLDLQYAFIEHFNNPKPVPKELEVGSPEFYSWVEWQAAPISKAYDFLELRAAEYVPEIKMRIKIHSHWIKESNKLLED